MAAIALQIYFRVSGWASLTDLRLSAYQISTKFLNALPRYYYFNGLTALR